MLCPDVLPEEVLPPAPGPAEDTPGPLWEEGLLWEELLSPLWLPGASRLTMVFPTRLYSLPDMEAIGPSRLTVSPEELVLSAEGDALWTATPGPVVLSSDEGPDVLPEEDAPGAEAPELTEPDRKVP